MINQIVISPAGEIKAIYTDELLPLFRAGKCSITRASSVEPTIDGRWEADLSPVNGPVLGPYDTRKEALESEVNYLITNVL